MKLKFRFTCCVVAMFLVMASTGFAASLAGESSPSMTKAAEALGSAMEKLGTTPDQPGFMVLTNAGYGQVDGKSTEAYLDLVAKTTGRTPGTRTLLAVNTPCYEPLWFALFRADTKDLVFIKSGPEGFNRQAFNIAPKQIFQPEAWAAAASGLVGKRMFSVVSISLSWAEGASWSMLKGAELHDHFCPGLNSGFIVKAFLDKELPLGAGDRYVFVGAAPNCSMDALQSVYGCTVGKRSAFSMMIPKAAKRAAKDGVAPIIIAMRVNAKMNVCDGVVIGLDWSKLGSATGVSKGDLSPEGGKSNPLFYIARAKMSRSLVRMSMKDKMACIADQRRFSGPASLVATITDAGADPYAVLPK
ncbi:FmdE family protein [uncultured Pseudodesulfovibrio sp.]|uniref:FmdE family protein n=1 Tax=uncultured Pseudodesulfovibrio sp. TaxID=2035858 RepID=UPI0029C67401|nr:FmdE family protein [uncultured Pseudodesulfovibrio sp.]